MKQQAEVLSINDRVDEREKEVSPYERVAAEIGKLVTEKNAAYGDSFCRSGAILGILYPNGINPDQYDDALAVTRILDKLFRIANDGSAFGESPYLDIAGYGILGAVRHEQKFLDGMGRKQRGTSRNQGKEEG